MSIVPTICWCFICLWYGYHQYQSGFKEGQRRGYLFPHAICAACGGLGKVTGIGPSNRTCTCPRCAGTGEVPCIDDNSKGLTKDEIESLHPHMCCDD